MSIELVTLSYNLHKKLTDTHNVLVTFILSYLFIDVLTF